MIVLKILGAIDIFSSLVTLMFIFGIHPFTPLILFCAGLLFTKGLFVITGDVLSLFDLISALVLILSIFFTIPAIILWTSSFLLIAKGFVSFI